MRTVITHWLPIVTFCPVNNLPDLIFVEMTFSNFVELYAARKKLVKLVTLKTMYMEDIAKLVMKELGPDKVVVRLMFNKHRVELEKE